MFEILSKTPVKVALATVGVAAVATASYVIGQRNGVVVATKAFLEAHAAQILDNEEDPDYSTTK